MKSLLGILTFMGFMSLAQAQRLCGTVEYEQQLIKANPSLKYSIDNAREHASSLAFRPSSNTVDTIPGQIITIPVVIHILYNSADENISDAQVLSQLASLNLDYRRQNTDTSFTPDVFKPVAADAKINFCLAQVDPNGKRTSGIIRKSTSVAIFSTDDAMKYSLQGGDDAWDCTKYLNIWVCNLINYSLGYSSPLGSPPDIDGVVVSYNVFGTVGDDLRVPYNKGRTATHEIGHWLGLRHTWGDAICGDDSIPDTPEQETYNFGCPSFPHVSSCSPNANGDMFMNYMDFSDDGCMNIFTRDQVKVMRALFSANGVRNSFLNSNQCDSNLAIQAGPVPVSTSSDSIAVDVIKVYPNPVHTQLYITINNVNKISEKTLHIYNTLGMEVYTTLLSQPKTTVNVSNLANGVYIVHIEDGSNVFTTRVIKE